jgi:D-cysteine desulfhydrase
MVTEPRRLSLARLKTPLERVLIDGRTVLMKRDDLTGAALTGNKIRKLEYLLAEAVAQGKRRVLTCGGIQSNHCRATAIAARRLGLDSLLFLRTSAPPPSDQWTGNLRLNQLVGAEVRFITPEQYRDRNALMADAAGADDYIIPEGGSNALGSWGYVRAYEELRAQWSDRPTAIICATGSGGTLAGLMMGSRFGLPHVAPEEVKMVDGYIGPGYAVTNPKQQADIERLARETGHLLDPVYTGKAFRALLHEPERFGVRPLFIHTGGIYGLLR